MQGRVVVLFYSTLVRSLEGKWEHQKNKNKQKAAGCRCERYPFSSFSSLVSLCLSLLWLCLIRFFVFFFFWAHRRTTSQQPTTNPQNSTVVITAWKPFRTLPRVGDEAELLAASSKGLPPPPKASGFDLAASLRWASVLTTVAMPSLPTVVGWKLVVAGAGGSEDSDDELVMVELEPERDEVVDWELSSVVDDGAGPFPSMLFGHR